MVKRVDLGSESDPTWLGIKCVTDNYFLCFSLKLSGACIGESNKEKETKKNLICEAERKGKKKEEKIYPPDSV